MPGKVDFVRKKYAPLLDRDLLHSLAHFLGEHLPRIGGERIRIVCAEMILSFLEGVLARLDRLTHGQALWLAVSVNDPPARGKRIADTDLVPVILDLTTPDDIQRIIDRVPYRERLRAKAVRLCHQAFAQGGLLGNCDLAELMAVDDSVIAGELAAHERITGKVIPRRATVHDVGTGLTHKRIICWKRYAEGKPSDQIARETFHSIEAVDRYLGQFDRVRCCRKLNMRPEEIVFTLNCSLSLVRQYLAIDDELNNPRRAEAGS
jgi:uncharacterized protein DUF1670